MRAIVVKPDQSLSWEEVADPVMKSDEVLVEIKATGLNRADLLQRAGKYPPPSNAPEWMGLEASGIVSAVGDNSNWQIGDKVCLLLGGGGYAEKVAVPTGQVMPMPSGLSFIEAASLPEAYATSYLNLVLEAGLKSGDTVFIQAAASGVGMAAVQIAKFFQTKVVAVVGSSEKQKVVSALGADIVINRKTDNLSEILANNLIDIALDCVGGKDLGQSLTAMKPGGRWILISTLGGETSEIPLRVVLKQGLKIIGSTLRGKTPEFKEKLLKALVENLWPAFENSKIKPIIHAVLPITAAEKAQAILQNNENIGKVILTIP